MKILITNISGASLYLPCVDATLANNGTYTALVKGIVFQEGLDQLNIRDLINTNKVTVAQVEEGGVGDLTKFASIVYDQSAGTFTAAAGSSPVTCVDGTGGDFTFTIPGLKLMPQVTVYFSDILHVAALNTPNPGAGSFAMSVLKLADGTKEDVDFTITMDWRE